MIEWIDINDQIPYLSDTDIDREILVQTANDSFNGHTMFVIFAWELNPYYYDDPEEEMPEEIQFVTHYAEIE